MRFLFIVSFLLLSLKAFNLENKSIVYLFKNNYYSYLCINRWKYINKYAKKREDLLSVVAYACLKKHYLTYALDLAKNLYTTKEGRINSTYIISLFTIKNYLSRYIADGFDISEIQIPNIISDDLGKAFQLAKKQMPKSLNNEIFLKDKEYNISVFYDISTNEMIIKFFKGNELIKKEKYW